MSTGGFTDCALRFGARHVIGVEVGHDQLDPELRRDPRVTCLEGLNARAMADDSRLKAAFAAQGATGPDLAVMDVSFISQTLILPQLAALLPRRRPAGQPGQAPVRRWRVNARGLVTDARYSEVEARIRDCCAEVGLEIRHWQPSPLLGGDGNREFYHAVRLSPTATPAPQRPSPPPPPSASPVSISPGSPWAPGAGWCSARASALRLSTRRSSPSLARCRRTSS